MGASNMAVKTETKVLLIEQHVYRRFWTFVPVQLKYIGPRIVPGPVEEPLINGNISEIDLGRNDSFLIIDRLY